jgi:transcriptional regulator with XRE-family HTH domain
MRHSLAEQISYRMKALGLSIRDLEKLANTKPNSVRYIIEGTTEKPNIFLVEDIAKALGCTIHELLDDSSYEEKMMSSRIKNTLGSFLNDILEKNGHPPADKEKQEEKYVSVENINLLKDCLNFVIDQTDPNKVHFKHIKDMAYDIYMFSMVKNDQNLSAEYAEWVLEKYKE